jgi:hypothetical protein
MPRQRLLPVSAKRRVLASFQDWIMAQHAMSCVACEAIWTGSPGELAAGFGFVHAMILHGKRWIARFWHGLERALADTIKAGPNRRHAADSELVGGTR